MNKGKKILAWILFAVLLAGAVFGIGIAVKRTTGGTVVVVPAGSFNYGGWYDDENTMEGVVTSEMSNSPCRRASSAFSATCSRMSPSSS